MFVSKSLRPVAASGLRARPKRLLAGVVAFRERSQGDWDSRRSSSSSTNNKNGWALEQGSSHARRDFLEARQLSLYELFDGNALLFDVPEYQRPYAWKAKQVRPHPYFQTMLLWSLIAHQALVIQEDFGASKQVSAHLGWLALQVQELLSDLQQAFAAGQEHFLGALVTTRRGEAAGEPYWVSQPHIRLATHHSSNTTTS